MTLFQHHLLALGITAATTLGLGLFVLWKNPRRNLHRSVAVYCFSLAWWSGWESAALQMPTTELVLQLFRIEYIGVAFIPTFLCTAVSFLLDFSPRVRKRFLLPLYAASLLTLVFASLFPTRQFLGVSSGPMAYLPFCPVAGAFYWVFLVFFLGTASVGHALIFLKWRHAEGQERARLGLFLAGSLVSYLGGCPEFVLKYGIRLGWLNPFGLYGVPLYIGILVYAIVQHRFLDIQVVIRRSLVYSLLIAWITATYLAVVLIVERGFQGFFGYHSIIATVFVAFLIAIFFDPLRKRIQALVDRALFHATPLELIRQREQLLREVQKADQLKAISTLAAGMAHEIKNPLTSIKTFAAYLPEKAHDPVFQQKFRRIVTQEVDKIDQIVRRLLDFAKPAPPRLQPTHVSQLLDETLEFLSSDCLKKRIQIERAYAPDGAIQADHQQLRQVFLNLLLNSLEAMDGHGGTLSVSTAQHDGHLTVTIQDTGQGIPDDQLNRLFEPFFTTKPRGTGLGLAIVQRILTEHHGTIAFNSQLPHGTRCTLTFPLNEDNGEGYGMRRAARGVW